MIEFGRRRASRGRLRNIIIDMVTFWRIARRHRIHGPSRPLRPSRAVLNLVCDNFWSRSPRGGRDDRGGPPPAMAPSGVWNSGTASLCNLFDLCGALHESRRPIPGTTGHDPFDATKLRKQNRFHLRLVFVNLKGLGEGPPQRWPDAKPRRPTENQAARAVRLDDGAAASSRFCFRTFSLAIIIDRRCLFYPLQTGG